jgi:L-threonine-O-3-phosphate decarboxylase
LAQTQQPSNRPPHGGNLVWAASVAGCSPSALIDFSASINPLGPPASAIAAIQSHLATLTSYPDPDYRSLRSALSQFHQIPTNWILPGNGAAELLTWACRDLAACECACLITPAFGDYQRALRAFDARVLPYPLEPLTTKQTEPHWRLHPAVAHPHNSSWGLLVNNPHNPTGTLFPRDEILSWLDRYSLVVVDEAFMDFLPPAQQQSLIDQVQHHPNLVIVRSLTKFYSLPGLRLGYAIAHPDRLQRWQQWRDPWSVNTLAAAAAEVVLQDTAFQQQTWQWLHWAKPKLFAALATLPGLFPHPGAANFLLVQSDRSVVELQTRLLQHHRILIRDCLSFPELGDRYFRIAIRSESENERLLQGLEEEGAVICQD